MQASENPQDDIRTILEKIEKDIETSNQKFNKWDGRLWGLTLGLIGTAWAAIFAALLIILNAIQNSQLASAVVITKAIAGI